MNIALLTAAGTGSRVGSRIPKQFIHVYDKPIILYTMEQFQKHPEIDGIFVVTLPDWKEIVSLYAQEYKISKLIGTVNGGETCQQSIMNGLNAISKEYPKDATILIHDGSRPLVSQEVISDSLTVYKRYGGAVAAIPTTEAVFVSEDGQTGIKGLDRDKLIRTQTPHTFTLGKLLDTYSWAKSQSIMNSTAVCSVLALMGEEIHFSKGNQTNLKITTSEDLEIFKSIIMRRRFEDECEFTKMKCMSKN